METLSTLPMAGWPAERRVTFERDARRAGWSKDHIGRVRRALELWHGRAAPVPTVDSLREFQGALEGVYTSRTAQTYVQAAVQGLTLLHPGLDWARLLSEARRRPRVRVREARAAEPDPLALWPDDWRARWSRARVSGGGRSRLRGCHAAARWSPAYARRVARGLSRFLRWSDGRRPTADLLEEYLASLDALASTSTAMLVEEVAIGLPIVEPDGDWTDLQAETRRLKAVARPKAKAARMVPQEALYSLGLTLMREAERKPFGAHAAVRLRDGLLIALLAARPARLSNIATLRIDDSLIEQGASLVLRFRKTKNDEEWTAAVPPKLEANMDRWLADYRPLLVARDRPDDGDVWIGLDGQALTKKAISCRIGDITLARLGRRVNPHLFRTIYATDLCEAEGDAHLAATMLGHRNIRTTEKHYRVAHSRRAAGALDSALQAYRMPVPVGR